MSRNSKKHRLYDQVLALADKVIEAVKSGAIKRFIVMAGCDGSSAFPYASPGMYDIYEVTPEEVQQDASVVFGRLHPEDYDMVSKVIFESARTLETFYCEFRVLLPKQGLRWRWSQAQPERMADDSILWHGIIVDITDRKIIDNNLPVISLVLEKHSKKASFFTTIATLGTPLDVTTQELRIELLFPSDDETKHLFSTVFQ